MVMIMKIYNLMFQNLLKAVTSSQPNTSSANPRSKPSPFSLNSNGWDDAPVNDKNLEKPRLKSGHPFLSDQPPIFGQKITGFKPQLYQSEHEDSKIAIQMNVSEEVSEKASQVLSINEFGQEEHPMIISNFRSNNPISFYRSIIIRIHQSTSELRMSYLDLVDFLQSQKSQYERLREQLTQQFFKFVSKYAATFGSKFDITERQSLERQVKAKSIQCIRLNRELTECKAQLENNKSITRNSSKRIQEEKIVCNKCRVFETEILKLKDEMKQTQQQLEKILIQNQHLQEYIFDMEQKVVGIDLQIEKRLKEKTKNVDLPPISPIRQDKELIEQLQTQISALQQKCKRIEDQKLQQKDIKNMENYLAEKENYIMQRENSLRRKQENIKENLAKIQAIKQQNQQRQHELVVAEVNLSKKIQDLRKKQSQLSAWQASLAQKEIGNRGQRDNTLANQFPSNDPSFQQSIQDLNRSGQSLKSFGRNPLLDDKLQGSPVSNGKFENYLGYYKVHTLNNEEDAYRNKAPHDFVRERNNYNVNERSTHLKTEGKKFGESAYVPKSKEHLNDIMTKKYNPQLSNYKDSREASPYRNLNEPVKTRPNLYHQYALPKNSPNHYRQASKNSKSSVSKGKTSAFSQQAAQSRGVPRNNNQLGGLGSKLERLREEIKKEIDSIK